MKYIPDHLKSKDFPNPFTVRSSTQESFLNTHYGYAPPVGLPGLPQQQWQRVCAKLQRVQELPASTPESTWVHRWLAACEELQGHEFELSSGFSFSRCHMRKGDAKRAERVYDSTHIRSDIAWGFSAAGLGDDQGGTNESNVTLFATFLVKRLVSWL